MSRVTQVLVDDSMVHDVWLAKTGLMAVVVTGIREDHKPGEQYRIAFRTVARRASLAAGWACGVEEPEELLTRGFFGTYHRPRGDEKRGLLAMLAPLLYGTVEGYAPEVPNKAERFVRDNIRDLLTALYKDDVRHSMLDEAFKAGVLVSQISVTI